jgi:hypothetical protein
MNQVKDLFRVNQHHVQIKYTSDVPCIKYNDVFNFYLNRWLDKAYHLYYISHK